jgi:hypothetical protein
MFCLTAVFKRAPGSFLFQYFDQACEGHEIVVRHESTFKLLKLNRNLFLFQEGKNVIHI